MPDVLERFRTFKTDHCVTGSMRHVYEFHGYPVSEDLLLGLGAGVGFIYWHMKGMPPFLGGRANVGRPGEEGLERTAGRRTGVAVELFETASAVKAEKMLADCLAHGPVMIRVDMGYLPYLKLPEGYHFGGHVIVVAGYDRAGNTLVANRDGKLHTVRPEDLAHARGSKFKPFPPRNALFTFDFSARRPPTANETRQAIGEVVKGMLHGPISNLGVRGIRKAAKCVGKWAETMSAEELRYACFNAYVFIGPIGGTGGGIFRYMYARFLKEAARITGERRLEAAAEELHAVGDQWQKVAGIFKKLPEPAAKPAGLSQVGDLLSAIADQEEAVWKRLQEML